MKKKRKQSSSHKKSNNNTSSDKDNNGGDLSSLCNISGHGDNTNDALWNLFDNSTSVNSTNSGTKSGATAGNSGSSASKEQEEEDCLALLDQQFTTTNSNKNNDNDTTDKQRQRCQQHQKQQQILQQKLLPNIQVELVRHKHMADMSIFLLSSSGKNQSILRMPSFERWVLDSNLEERIKRQEIRNQSSSSRHQQVIREEDGNGGGSKKKRQWKARQKRNRPGFSFSSSSSKNNDNSNEEENQYQHHLTSSGKNILNKSDPVIPSMADVNDEASKRLLLEMNTSLASYFENTTNNNSGNSNKNNKEKKKKKDNAIIMMTQEERQMVLQNGQRKNQQIIFDLCQMAREASRHVQNLNHHLGDGIDLDKYFAGVRGGGGGKAKKMKGSLGRIVLETTIFRSGNDENDDGNHGTKQAEEETKEESNSKTYSLVYSRKPSSSSSGSASSNNANSNGGGGDQNNDPKPFIVKINATHYDKLRDMFHTVHSNDALSSSSSSYATTTTTSMENVTNLYVTPISELSKYSNNKYNKKYYTPATNIFHHLVFCLLVRYASFSGGQQLLDLRGGGMQGAIHEQVFDVLSNYLLQSKKEENKNEEADCDGTMNLMECFASPLNVYNQRFCSAFYDDLDCHFGSCGDFFQVPLGFFEPEAHEGEVKKEHVHEANPPFAPGMMAEMIERMEDHLTYAKQYERKLSFLIVVPTCTTSDTTSSSSIIQKFAKPSFQRMLQSPYFAKHMVLKARSHGYVEGSQHLRPTRYKESQYDTSLILLQSHAADTTTTRVNTSKKRRKTLKKDDEGGEEEEFSLTSKEVEMQLRQAFESQHHEELKQRRG